MCRMICKLAPINTVVKYNVVMNKVLVNFLYEIGSLRRLERSYHLSVLTQTESVAEHSHRAMIIAYFLAKLCKAQAEKAMMMAAFHDMAETRTGDSDWVQKQYLSQDEQKALDRQLLPLGGIASGLKLILKEYKERKSLESQIAKDADYIEYFMSLKELAWAGNKEAEQRLGSENTALNHMYTKQGKKLAREVKAANPVDWVKEDLVATHKNYRVVR